MYCLYIQSHQSFKIYIIIAYFGGSARDEIWNQNKLTSKATKITVLHSSQPFLQTYLYNDLLLNLQVQCVTSTFKLKIHLSLTPFSLPFTLWSRCFTKSLSNVSECLNQVLGISLSHCHKAIVSLSPPLEAKNSYGYLFKT